MNKKIAALTLASLVATCSHYAFAAETTTQESTLPPTAIPGINQAQGSESNEEKADKKGEEAAGSNSGADAETLEKDAKSTDDGTKQSGSGSGS
ncbi:hypothetical protein ACYZTX_12315 [Pseudomonas sp. MDT1-17]